MIERDNIITRLLAHAVKFPYKKAFILPGDNNIAEVEIGYQELVYRVANLSDFFQDNRWTGQRVLLVYQDILDFIIAFFACQFSGLIPVPVAFPGSVKQIPRLVRILKDADAGIVLSSSYSADQLNQRLREVADNNAARLVCTDQVSANNVYRGLVLPAYQKTALIQYTSGSTEDPKGVMITHCNLMHNQGLIMSAFGCSEDSIILSWLPFHHDMGLIGNILHAVYTGCTAVLMSPSGFIQNPFRWLEAVSKYRASHSGGPNFAYDLCKEKVPTSQLTHLDLSCWTVAYNGSEPVRWDTLRSFAEHFRPAGFRAGSFKTCYGLAEATLLVSAYKETDMPLPLYIERDVSPSGRILPAEGPGSGRSSVVTSGAVAEGIDCRIISRLTGNECMELEEGEICISGGSVTQGYWNRNDEEAFFMLDGKRFLRTGDLGFFHKGQLFIHGRIKEMLIIRGRNIYPQDIERMVEQLDVCIMPNGVAAFGSGGEGENLFIAVELKREYLRLADKEQVIGAIDAAVGGSFGINAFDIVLTTPHGIPRTTSGKIQRARCMSDYTAKRLTVLASKRDLRSSTTGVEILRHEVMRSGEYESIVRYVVNRMESSLQRPLPVPHDEHMELSSAGLDSMRAVQLINTINNDLPIHLELSVLSKVNTLSEFCHMIEALLWLKTKKNTDKEITI